jgi:hypothetical protein
MSFPEKTGRVAELEKAVALRVRFLFVRFFENEFLAWIVIIQTPERKWGYLSEEKALANSRGLFYQQL